LAWRWPFRSKHVAVIWPDCVYYITVLIYCCVLTVYNMFYKFVTAQRDGLCKIQKFCFKTIIKSRHRRYWKHESFFSLGTGTLCQKRHWHSNALYLYCMLEQDLRTGVFVQASVLKHRQSKKIHEVILSRIKPCRTSASK
jgi:hypothetical protein